jgi:NAD(P)-dependent dehydrogenase (short-subunit alcohol dehydrogenase family)
MHPAVLVTGCSSGLGLATARHLAAQGIPVLATVLAAEEATPLAGLERVETFVCDITDDDQVARLRAAIDARGGGLRGLVNNAGIAHYGLLTETSVDALRSVFEVNVFGMHRVTKAVVDLVVASRGRIVNVSSISGTLSSPTMGVYAMTKHAVESFTDSLAAELVERGVHVCAVAPGNYASSLIAHLVRRFPLPPTASEEFRRLYEAGADTSRSEHPAPTAVAEAIHAALVDPAPLDRYLVVPKEAEAVRTLRQAALELARLNRSTPYRRAAGELAAWLAEAGGDASR